MGDQIGIVDTTLVMAELTLARQRIADLEQVYDAALGLYCQAELVCTEAQRLGAPSPIAIHGLNRYRLALNQALHAAHCPF